MKTRRVAGVIPSAKLATILIAIFVLLMTGVAIAIHWENRPPVIYGGVSNAGFSVG